MASKQHLLLILLLLLPFLTLISPSQSALTLDHYNKTCPKFHEIMQRVASDKQIANPTTAAAVLRLFFHDCMVGGCDGSVLITSNTFNVAERDSELDVTLPGDGFDMVTRAKSAVELACPGTVSCSDILAVAARDLVTMVGGPFYQVPLGRMDSLVSKSSRVEGNVARPNMSVTTLISMFEAKGLSIKDLVALSGAHTIGFSHCKEFANRVFNFSKTSRQDPSINPKYAQALQKLCSNYTKDPAVAAFNDVITPGKFDNMYFVNLKKGLGLLASDQALVADPRTKKYVDLYANNETAFFHDFADAMHRAGLYNVKTKKDGEIRRRCDVFNTLNTNPGKAQKA